MSSASNRKAYKDFDTVGHVVFYANGQKCTIQLKTEAVSVLKPVHFSKCSETLCMMIDPSVWAKGKL